MKRQKYRIACSHLWDVDGVRIESGEIIEHTGSDDELDYVTHHYENPEENDPREHHLDAGSVTEGIENGELEPVRAEGE